VKKMGVVEIEEWRGVKERKGEIHNGV